MASLTHKHFDAVRNLPNAVALLEWAWQADATVKEMLAWGRVGDSSSDPSPAPAVKRQPASVKKPAKPLEKPLFR